MEVEVQSCHSPLIWLALPVMVVRVPPTTEVDVQSSQPLIWLAGPVLVLTLPVIVLTLPVIVLTFPVTVVVLPPTTVVEVQSSQLVTTSFVVTGTVVMQLDG
jgi:hypothetical protein